MKIIKIAFLHLLLTSIIASAVYANSARTDSIIIEGFVNWHGANYKTNDSIYCTISLSEYPVTMTNMSRLPDCLVEGFAWHTRGKFLIAIRAKRKYMYMTIQVKFPGKDRSQFYSPNNLYILEAGDYVKCQLKPNSISFDGTLSVKYRCQSEIYSKYISYDKFAMLVNQKAYQRAYDWERLSEDSVFRLQLETLERYKNKLSEALYAMIMEGCRARRYHTMLESMRLDIVAGTEYRNDLLQYYNATHIHEKVELMTRNVNAKLAIQSPLFLNLLLESIYMDVQVAVNMHKPYTRPPYAQFYKQIMNHFSGVIREGVLALSYAFLRGERADAKRYLDSSIAQINTGQYKIILLGLKQREGVGMPFHDFILSDSSGKNYTLNDFKGKLVFLDFWYSGCVNCITLKKIMAPFYDYFRNEKRIQFVSISIDEEKNRWKQSLKNGLYTDATELNLYTNGNGEYDSLVSYYNIKGFPKQMILVNGILFEPDVPRPGPEKNPDKFPESEQSKTLFDIILRGLKTLENIQ